MSSEAPPGAWRRLRRLISIRAVALTAGLIAALGVVGLGVAIEITSQPPFCGSCHIMEPYYRSWQVSSHRHIACVECHIAPGVTAELRKKYEALSMVAKYFTATYGTNPWAEVEDAACLKCHERRLLQGKELFGDVVFDHTAHLTTGRRGLSLRCTSCHGQIVQGSHIAVTASTCVLCHFKGQEAGAGLARCTLCHQVPDRTISRGALRFNHGDVGRFGMSCTACHARPEGAGDGEVPRERCVTCHNDPGRLARIGEVETLHRRHVSERKVECLNCHLEVRHVGEARIETAVASCDACHRDGHSPQLSLYSGRGGRGVEPMPSAMFTAGVRCQGCHVALPGHEQEVRRASPVSCMSCHGPRYADVLSRWKETLAGRSGALARLVAATEAAIPAGSHPPALDDARFNLDLVERGHGVHNVDYAFALLDRSLQDLNTARADRRLPGLEAPWPALPASPCLRCHQGIEDQAGTRFGREFAHRRHLVQAKLGCDACHRPHEERAKGEVVRFGAAGCEDCHHQAPLGDCLSCHAGIKKRQVKSFRGAFDHALHVDENELGCTDCHALAPGKPVALQRDTCATCHKK